MAQLPSHAAHHVAALRRQEHPGQVVMTPCPHCGRSLPRLECIAHARACPSRPADAAAQPPITINSPEAAGARGHDGMEDA